MRLTLLSPIKHGSTSSKARLSKEPAATSSVEIIAKTKVERFILYTNLHPTEHSQKSDLMVLLESSHSGLAKVQVYKEIESPVARLESQEHSRPLTSPSTTHNRVNKARCEFFPMLSSKADSGHTVYTTR